MTSSRALANLSSCHDQTPIDELTARIKDAVNSGANMWKIEAVLQDDCWIPRSTWKPIIDNL